MSGTPGTMTEDEFANLSDEEIMNMAVPPTVSSPSQEGSGEAETQTLSTEESADHEDQDADPDGSGEASDEDGAVDDPDDLDLDDEKESGQADPEGKDEDGQGEGDPEPEAKDDKESEAGSEEDKPEEPPEVDYKSAYEKIFAPFKANGKEVKMTSPDEVVQLMQMGANYTKKLQALQPHLRMVKMLENNGLMDEAKVSYLIDLSKGNTKAVQKLVKESGIDPMDIDTAQESTYRPGNYRVSEEEMAFSSTLEEVASDPAGKEVIHSINKTWDAQSKETLWKEPAILRELTKQKTNGIYDQIVSEVERQQLLGNHQGTPFLQAYFNVGQEMQQQGKLNPATPAKGAQNPGTVTNDSQPATQQQSRIVETRRATKKAPDVSERVRAASPTRSAPKAAQADFNPLSLSDEDFEKNAELAKRL